MTRIATYGRVSHGWSGRLVRLFVACAVSVATIAPAMACGGAGAMAACCGPVPDAAARIDAATGCCDAPAPGLGFAEAPASCCQSPNSTPVPEAVQAQMSSRESGSERTSSSAVQVADFEDGFASAVPFPTPPHAARSTSAASLCRLYGVWRC